MYNVALIGNWGLASEVMEVLHGSNQMNLKFVITQMQADKLSDRWYGAVHNRAKDIGVIAFNQSDFKGRSDKIVELVEKYDLDLMVSCAYPYLVGEDLINVLETKKGLVNIHGSALPKYRGVSPVVWAVINNDKEIGITLHYIDKGCDSGDIIYQSSILNNPADDLDKVTDKLKIEGVKIFSKFISDLESNISSPRLLQDHSKSIPAPRVRGEDLKVDFNQSAELIAAFVRATFKDGPYIVIDNKLATISSVEITESRGKPSKILQSLGDCKLEVGTGTYNVIVTLSEALEIDFQANHTLDA